MLFYCISEGWDWNVYVCVCVQGRWAGAENVTTTLLMHTQLATDDDGNFWNVSIQKTTILIYLCYSY